MITLKCDVCGAGSLPETSFCRQCGSAVGDSEKRSEAPTAHFSNPPGSVSTQRLDPRPTGPEPGTKRPAGAVTVGPPSSVKRPLVIGGLVLVLIIVGVLTTWLVMRNAKVTSDAGALLYPAAQTVVDMTGPDGGRAIHLQTRDPLDRVESWYQTNLKFSKTVRLTSKSVVMKKEKVTITVAEEDGTTNILIKQAP